MRLYSIELPIRTVSEANVRCHHFARAKRAKQQRGLARAALRVPLLGFGFVCRSGRDFALAAPVEVELTRLGPRTLDTDNAAGALKATRDGVADALGIDDGDARVRWVYAQEKSKMYGVRITVRGMGA